MTHSGLFPHSPHSRLTQTFLRPHLLGTEHTLPQVYTPCSPCTSTWPLICSLFALGFPAFPRHSVCGLCPYWEHSEHSLGSANRTVMTQRWTEKVNGLGLQWHRSPVAHSCWSTHLSIHPLVHSSIRSFICPFIYLFI